jgi:hypothetical protein
MAEVTVHYDGPVVTRAEARDDLIFDPFVGSGTTIIAAETTGRVFHAIEIAPAYVDVGVRRWQNFTGQQATLDGDGRSFDQIAAERSPQTAAVEAA